MKVRREKRINVITVSMMEAKREKQQGCFAPHAYTPHHKAVVNICNIRECWAGINRDSKHVQTLKKTSAFKLSLDFKELLWEIFFMSNSHFKKNKKNFSFKQLLFPTDFRFKGTFRRDCRRCLHALSVLTGFTGILYNFTFTVKRWKKLINDLINERLFLLLCSPWLNKWLDLRQPVNEFNVFEKKKKKRSVWVW